MLQDDVISGNRLTATSSGGFAAVQGAAMNNGGELVLRDTKVSGNAGVATGPSGYAHVVTRNSLTGGAGVSVSGGGLFTTAPVVQSDSSIRGNTPDDCAGC